MMPLSSSNIMSLSRMPNLPCHQRRFRRRLVSCDHQRRFFYLSAVLMIVIMSRSEAFASLSTSSTSQQQQRASGSSGIFGQRLIVVPPPPFLVRRRGGSQSNQRKEVTCVMQQMPPLKANNNYDNYDKNNGNGAVHVKKNGVRRDATLKNGSSNGHEKASVDNSSASNKKTMIPVEFVAETKLPTELGQFQLRAYRVPGAPLGQEPCVIYYRDKPPFGGGSDAEDAIPVRIHDQCLTSEVFGSRRCDCKEQLHMALQYIKKHGGVVIYLQQEGRGIGLANKVAAYSLQDHGLDTVDANLHLGFPDDAREYSVVPSILQDMNIQRIALMTNNPRKTNMLSDLGILVDKTLPMVVPQTNQYNHKYMETKVARMNHRNMGDLLLLQNNNNDTEYGGSFVAPSSSSAYYASSSRLLLGTTAEQLAIANGMMAPRRAGVSSRSSPKIIIRGGDVSNSSPSTVDLNSSSTASASPSATTGNGYNSSVIDEITAMPANAVHVSLEVLKDDEEQKINEQLGIQARDDGYCLGKQSVLDAIAAIKRGEMIVVVDDLDRENEGDFIMAADKCTDLDMAKIVRYSSGVVCIGMDSERMDELNLPAMVTNNEDPKGTAFSVSVDATKEHGITTGISAGDRAITMKLLANPNSKASDFHRPGHIFPLRAAKNGVLDRNGHTEAAVDFAKLAGLNPAGVLCEIVSEENPTEMMRLPEIKRFCQRNQYVLTSIADLAQYRRETESNLPQQPGNESENH